jgi:hypothetical protein
MLLKWIFTSVHAPHVVRIPPNTYLYKKKIFLFISVDNLKTATLTNHCTAVIWLLLSES